MKNSADNLKNSEAQYEALMSDMKDNFFFDEEHKKDFKDIDTSEDLKSDLEELARKRGRL